MSEELKKECIDFIFNESNYDNESFHDSVSVDKLKSFISSLLAKQQEEFVKMVDKIPTEVPEYENNDYDKGRKDFKADIKSKLNI